MSAVELLKSEYKKIIVIGLIIGFLSLLLFLMTRDHWWRKVSSATVTYNDRKLNNSRVYLSKGGDILVCLEDLPDERHFYIAFVKGGRVGLPNENQFYFLPGYAYSKETFPPVVFMRSAKAEEDPNLLINDTAVAFTTLNGARIDVKW